MSPKKPPTLGDQAERDRAVTDFTTNLVMTAGAGTGKTSLLVERVLMDVAGRGTPLERIVAITFTEKAAAEMRIRIAQALERLWRLARGAPAASPEESDEAARAFPPLARMGIAREMIEARSLQALGALDGARITTLHGFCAELLHRHPQAAGVDAGFQVDEGPALKAAVKEAWGRFLVNELGVAPGRAHAWREGLRHFSLSDLRALAEALSTFKIPLDRVDGDGALARARGLLTSAGEEIGADVNDEALARAIALVLPFARDVAQRTLRGGHVSFDGLLQKARDLLRDHPDVRRRVRASIDAILVDEFQDTDPLQYEIVFFLAEEGEGEAADAYAARLAPGRLFIVGDPKQSIYRFRGADMSAYQRAVRHVVDQGGEVLVLNASFRAPDVILDPLNTLFSKMIGTQGEAALAYEPLYHPIRSGLAKKRKGTQGIEIWSVTLPGVAKVYASDRRLAEGQVIAQWIGAEVDAARVKYAEIALLFRSFTNVDLYLRALRERGIPFVADGGSAFYDRPEVADLVSFLRAAANPNDPAALLAVLRSSLGGCSDVELARLAAAGHLLRLDALARVPSAQFPNVARAMASIHSYRERIRKLPVDEALYAVLDALALLELNAAAYQGAQRVANLRKLIDRVAAVARREALSFEACLDVLDEEYLEEKREGDSPLADESVNAVRVYTVHRAKGLEFPIVIIPDLARRQAKRKWKETAAWIRLEAPDGSFEALAASIGGLRNCTHALAGVQHERHEEAEEKRVFYVGCTRAKEQLILVNGDPSPTRQAAWVGHLAHAGYKPEKGFPNVETLAGGIRHRVLVAPGRVPQHLDAPDVARYAGAVRAFEDAAERARTAAVSRFRAPSGLREEMEWKDTGEEEISRRAPATLTSMLPRAIGLAVHAALEKWDFEDRGALDRILAAAAREVALDLDLAPEEVEGASSVAIAGLLASDLPARLRRATLLGREVPMLLEEDGVIWWGSIDLLIREGGETVVLDWKTDDDPGFAQNAASRHGGQLRVYARAVRRALGLSALPRCELAHVRTGKTVIVPAGEGR